MAATVLLLLFLLFLTAYSTSCALQSSPTSTAIAVLKARDRVSAFSVPHSALITPPPQTRDQVLLKRDTIATCGYVSGDAGP